MTTRPLLKAFFSASDLLELARLSLAGSLLVALDGLCARLERWIDERGNA